ncbi:MAG: hypothetical protein WED09_05260 [Homoserinimonas sp.]
MVTLEQARAIVEAHEADEWRLEDGTLYVAPEGYEDADSWLVVVGARELLVDDDAAYLMLDDRALTVDKITGKVIELNSLRDAARLGAMTPAH